MNTVIHNANFYREEIAVLSRIVRNSDTPASQRNQFARQLTSATRHLAALQRESITTYFDRDNFTARRSNSPAAGNGFDPESLITGAEIKAGFTYTNSHRAYPGQDIYDALVTGVIPASYAPIVAPRVFNA